jgi:hypothetical protein
VTSGARKRHIEHAQALRGLGDEPQQSPHQAFIVRKILQQKAIALQILQKPVSLGFHARNLNDASARALDVSQP